MRENELFELLGGIDVDLIDRAQSRMSRKRNFIRRMPWYTRLASLAAAIAIIIASFIGIRYLHIGNKYKSPFTLVDTAKAEKKPLFSFGANKPSAPPLPWENTLHLKVYTETSSYLPSDTVTLKLEIGLNNGFLGKGDLLVTVKAAEFDASFEFGASDTGLLIKDFTSKDYTASHPYTNEIYLNSRFDNSNTSGNVAVSVRFIPHDLEAFTEMLASTDLPSYNDRWQETFLDGGMLRMLDMGFLYAANRLELRIATSAPRYGGSLFYELLADHYKTGRISGRELADMYYSNAYDDRIFAAMTSYKEADQTFRFEYISRNIRYQCDDYISDERIWTLSMEISDFMLHSDSWEDTPEITEKRYEVARLILKRMHDTGVITEDEYNTELSLVSSVRYVGNFQIAFGSDLGGLMRIIRKYRYTHG